MESGTIIMTMIGVFSCGYFFRVLMERIKRKAELEALK